jgi:hypothetical protein
MDGSVCFFCSGTDQVEGVRGQVKGQWKMAPLCCGCREYIRRFVDGQPTPPPIGVLEPGRPEGRMRLTHSVRRLDYRRIPLDRPPYQT